jgi:hypothetical protein
VPAAKALITKYPILGYYILTFATSWGILLLVIYARITAVRRPPAPAERSGRLAVKPTNALIRFCH